MGFYAKNSQAMDRENKVQRLVIPFTVTASATPSAVVVLNDEPSILFIATQGNDQISPEVAALGDTATYSSSPSDASGRSNLYLTVSEPVQKVMQAQVIDRANGGSLPCKLGSSSGLSSLGNIMLTATTSIDYATTSANLCLIVEYVVQDGH